VIAATPIELRLMHRFYTKWMYCFDPSVTSTPWQTYPGHVPCPLPKDQSLSYQWTPEGTKQLGKVRMSQTLRDIEMALRQRSFPPALSRTQLLLSALLHRAGLRNHDSFFTAARTYMTYWANCISQDDVRALNLAQVRIQRVEGN
jgi:asparagine synthase (glutamine-hydrolysing)